MEMLNSDKESFSFMLDKQRSNYEIIIKEKQEILNKLTELLQC
jgi:hypothetical protein